MSLAKAIQRAFCLDELGAPPACGGHACATLESDAESGAK